MKIRLRVLILTAAFLLTGCSAYQVETEESAAPTQAVQPVTSISAADDFYGYVNLKKLDTLQIGYGSVYAGSFIEAQDFVDKQVDTMLDEIVHSSSDFPKGSCQQLVRDIYRLYLEADTPSQDAPRFFDNIFGEINSVSDIDSYTALMSRLLRDFNVPLLFELYVDADIMRPQRYAAGIYPSYSIFGMSDLKSLKEERNTESMLFAQSVLKAVGVPEKEAKKRAKDIMFMFLDIANSTDFDLYENPLDLYDHITELSFAKTDELLSSISLESYFKGCGARLPEKMYVGSADALKVINSYLTQEHLQTLKDCALCLFVSAYGDFLPEEYSSLRARYFPRILSVKEKEAMECVKQVCNDEISRLYADRFMDDEVIAKTREMCEDMRSAYSKLINNADWLSPEAKRLLNVKLQNMEFMIGGEKSAAPDPGNDPVGKDLLETLVNIAKKTVSDKLANINKPYDRLNFGMPSNMVNACYDTANTITVPYAILHEPFFDPNADEAVNLGAIGSIIAHEMSHAFDSDCIKFDMNGCYNPDWIPKNDILAFEKKMDLVRDYYSGFTIIDVYHVDGELTLGENFADLGGFECVMSAVGTDSEKKQLMESYARTWCCLAERKYAVQMLRDDEHSPETVRTNAVLSSCGDFYRLYNVKQGDGMYVPPEKRVSRW